MTFPTSMKHLRIEKILRERQAFIKKAEVKYENEFEFLDQVYELGKSMIERKVRDPSDEYRFFKEILLTALVRTVNRIQSITSLLMLGNSPDGALILRSIIDEAINILYLEKEPILRSYLYLRHGSKERIEVMKRGMGCTPCVRQYF